MYPINLIWKWRKNTICRNSISGAQNHSERFRILRGSIQWVRCNNIIPGKEYLVAAIFCKNKNQTSTVSAPCAIPSISNGSNIWHRCIFDCQKCVIDVHGSASRQVSHFHADVIVVLASASRQLSHCSTNCMQAMKKYNILQAREVCTHARKK